MSCISYSLSQNSLSDKQIQSEKPALSLRYDMRRNARGTFFPPELSANRTGTMFIVCERLVPPRAAAVYTTPNNFSWRHEKISGRVGT